MKTGIEAILFAAANNLTLSKYADPVEGERHGLSVEEARDIAKEDPSLIYLDTYQVAEDWYNETPKAELIAWATANGIDIGQNESQLHEDWSSKIIEAKAATL